MRSGDDDGRLTETADPATSAASTRSSRRITELLIRLIAGGSLAFHGYQILFGNIEGAARFFESVGFDNGLMWAWVVGILEFVCGLLLALGLFTRLAAGPIIVFLIVAIVTYHWEYGYNWEARGIEYPLFWAIVVFHFLDPRRRAVVARST